MKLHDSASSGNCYKVRLLLHHLDRPYERVPLDLKRGEARTPEFRARVPLGRVPALELDDGTMLGESNAMLWYLAEDTPFMAAGRLERAQTLQWMFWEQYSHEPYVAVVRAWLHYFGVPDGKERELEERRGRGEQALDTMERHLAGRTFFVGERYGLADIALYAYTHVAHQGGFDLGHRPAIQAWIERVRAQPRHIAIED